MKRTILLALALLALSTPAAARPALPPPPAHVAAVPLPGGAWRLEWAQQSDATVVIVGAGTWSQRRAGAPLHSVVVPYAWDVARDGATIAEGWDGEEGEVWIVRPAILDEAVYLPALQQLP